MFRNGVQGLDLEMFHGLWSGASRSNTSKRRLPVLPCRLPVTWNAGECDGRLVASLIPSVMTVCSSLLCMLYTVGEGFVVDLWVDKPACRHNSGGEAATGCLARPHAARFGEDPPAAPQPHAACAGQDERESRHGARYPAHSPAASRRPGRLAPPLPPNRDRSYVPADRLPPGIAPLWPCLRTVGG